MIIEKKIEELGLQLPKVEKPVATYAAAVRSGDILYVTGQLPFVEGELKYTGKFGVNLSVEQGRIAAEICTLNSLRVIKDETGDLDKIKKVIKVNGFLNCAPDFTQHSQITEGASLLLVKLFGDAGYHTRTSLGLGSMPLNAPLAIELTVELKN